VSLSLQPQLGYYQDYLRPNSNTNFSLNVGSFTGFSYSVQQFPTPDGMEPLQ